MFVSLRSDNSCWGYIWVMIESVTGSGGADDS